MDARCGVANLRNNGVLNLTKTISHLEIIAVPFSRLGFTIADENAVVSITKQEAFFNDV